MGKNQRKWYGSKQGTVLTNKRDAFIEQIEADTLKEEHGDVIDEIVELITDVMITHAPTLRVAGADRKIEDLIGLFIKLTAAHVELIGQNILRIYQIGILS